MAVPPVPLPTALSCTKFACLKVDVVFMQHQILCEPVDDQKSENMILKIIWEAKYELLATNDY